MRFASCEVGSRRFAAAVDGDYVVPLKGVEELGRATPCELLADPILDRSQAIPMAEVSLRPVIPHPRRIICVGLNYMEHANESKRQLTEYPVLFAKFADALIGPYDSIVKPPESAQVDYEAELAVIIGRMARRVPKERASQVIAGYTVANDVTMRDFQYKSHQWLQGKSWAGATPVGPWCVTPDELGPVDELEVSLSYNGRRLQHGQVSAMLFDVPTLVETISQFTALEPGDLILTGTPSGVGYRRDPQVFLEPGDVVSVEIPGVGRLENAISGERLVDGRATDSGESGT